MLVTRLFVLLVIRTPPKTGWHVLPMEQQVDLSLFFEYPDEDDEADVAKDEHYEFYEADVDEKYQSDEAVYEVPIQQKFNHFLG